MARFPVRVGLARDPIRILAWVGLRLIIAEVGLLVGMQTPGAIGLAVTLAGVAVLGYVILLTLHVLSLRLEILSGEVRLTSVLVRRRYPVHAGAVTRLRVEPRKGVLGTQLGAFGIEIGAGRTASAESIDVVRLASTENLILIPTRPVRLAVVPSSERTLLRALELAAEGIGLGARRIDDQKVPSRPSR